MNERVALLILSLLGVSAAAAQLDSDGAYDSDYRAAVEAFESARQSLSAGELRAAEKLFDRARRLAPANSELRHRAEEQLGYKLPLLRVQRLVFTGHTAGAERALRDLLAEHGDHPQRKAELEQMIARLNQTVRSAPPTTQVDGRVMLRQLSARLEEYRRANERYPRGYRELNVLLPADRAPLDHYEIVEYSATGGGYKMLLRSKSDPGNTLTLQKTGLLR